MNSTSYMFSFVLGLIVVIVFIVVLNSRFHFVNNVFKTSGSTVAVISPTPEPTITAFPTQAAVVQVRPTTRPTAIPTAKPQSAARVLAQATPTSAPSPTAKPQPTVMARANTTQPQVKGVSQIPNTGFPTGILMILPATLVAGIKLRRSA